MKLSYILFIAAITIPLSQGRTPLPPPRPPRPGNGRRHLRKSHQPQQRRRRTKSSKGDGKGCDDAGNSSSPPLPRLDSGCPCFSLDTIASQMDFGAAEVDYCDYYESNHDDNDDGETWHEHSFHAGSELSFRSEPPVLVHSSVSFNVYKKEESGIQLLSCYASISNDQHFAHSSTNNDNGTGIYQEDYNGFDLTVDEYAECINVMNTLKSQLPSSCSIND